MESFRRSFLVFIIFTKEQGKSSNYLKKSEKVTKITVPTDEKPVPIFLYTIFADE